jgi:acyl-CoA synthetase (AMP-forming)/AMP-acid ligase II
MRVHDYLEYWAAADPSAPCVEEDDRQWTYCEVESKSNQVAHGLAAMGLSPGDRCAILAENCLEWFPLYYGAFKAGVVAVPLNHRLHPREWAYIAADAHAAVLFAQHRFLSELGGVELAARGRRVAIGETNPGWVALDELLDKQPTSRVVHRAGPGSDLYQMYTSGTTGRPKGAVLTHGAVLANIDQMRAAVPLAPRPRVLVVGPLFHAGSAVSSFSTIASGGSLLVRPSFDPADCVRCLDERGVTTATFVPAMIQAMLVGVDGVRERSYDGLERIGYGASPIAESTLRDAMGVFGCEFSQGYGLTESSAVITVLTSEDHRRALEGRPELLLSCGRPVPGTEVRIVDQSDHDAAVGERGEIVVRGPQLMRGYWNLPEATWSALRDGWLHTGDVGYVDDAGYVYLCDRLHDMIVSGGENVYPREVEDVLFDMPEIADAAVIGVPDERWGETVKAVVVARPGHELTSDAVISWCRGHLGGYKCPTRVDIVAELPRNASGKVLKRLLRQPYERDS